MQIIYRNEFFTETQVLELLFKAVRGSIEFKRYVFEDANGDFFWCNFEVYDEKTCVIMKLWCNTEDKAIAVAKTDIYDL